MSDELKEEILICTDKNTKEISSEETHNIASEKIDNNLEEKKQSCKLSF
jgi:hypothetical protein